MVCLGILCCFPLRLCHPKGWLDRKVKGGLSHVWQLVLDVVWAASVLLSPPVGRTGLASCQGQAGFQEGRGQKQQDLMRPSLHKSQNATLIKSYWSERVWRPAQIHGDQQTPPWIRGTVKNLGHIGSISSIERSLCLSLAFI